MSEDPYFLWFRNDADAAMYARRARSIIMNNLQRNPPYQLNIYTAFMEEVDHRNADYYKLVSEMEDQFLFYLLYKNAMASVSSYFPGKPDKLNRERQTYAIMAANLLQDLSLIDDYNQNEEVLLLRHKADVLAFYHPVEATVSYPDPTKTPPPPLLSPLPPSPAPLPPKSAMRGTTPGRSGFSVQFQEDPAKAAASAVLAPASAIADALTNPSSTLSEKIANAVVAPAQAVANTVFPPEQFISPDSRAAASASTFGSMPNYPAPSAPATAYPPEQFISPDSLRAMSMSASASASGSFAGTPSWSPAGATAGSNVGFQGDVTAALRRAGFGALRAAGFETAPVTAQDPPPATAAGLRAAGFGTAPTTAIAATVMRSAVGQTAAQAVSAVLPASGMATARTPARTPSFGLGTAQTAGFATARPAIATAASSLIPMAPPPPPRDFMANLKPGFRPQMPVRATTAKMRSASPKRATKQSKLVAAYGRDYKTNPSYLRDKARKAKKKYKDVKSWQVQRGDLRGGTV